MSIQVDGNYRMILAAGETIPFQLQLTDSTGAIVDNTTGRSVALVIYNAAGVVIGEPVPGIPGEDLTGQYWSFTIAGEVTSTWFGQNYYYEIAELFQNGRERIISGKVEVLPSAHSVDVPPGSGTGPSIRFTGVEQ